MEKAKFVPLKAEETSYQNIWNPLSYMTEEMVRMTIDGARSGRISQIQLLFSLVEQSDSVLSMCLTRRDSAFPDWTIKRRDTRKYRGFDEKLADEQEAFLYDNFVRAEDSGTLIPALQNLHHAVFRGLGVVEPIYDAYDGLKEIVSLDPWNFAIDYTKHDQLGQYPLYWNPTGKDVFDFKNDLKLIPPEQIVANFNERPIDNFALQIYLAENMGWESYCKLIARRGLPSTYIIAPEDLPSEQIQTWADKALQCAAGGSGAFPYGSNVITEKIDAQNGQSIQDFLEFCHAQTVLASTGGTLTSLASPTGLGSNIASVQEDVFKTIVRHDAYQIGDRINRGIAKKLLDWAFPGKPHLVFFDLSASDKQPPEKYLEDAAKAKSAGLSIDIQQLQELTGYRLTADAPQSEQNGVWNVPRITNAETPTEAPEAKIEVVDEVSTEEAVEEAAEELVQPSTEESEEVEHGVSILRAFDKVLKPIRALFQKLFAAKTKEESDAMVAELNEKIREIEESDDTELRKAVEKLLVDEFSKKEEE